MSTIASVMLLLGRIFFVAMFVVSAWGNVVNHQRYVTLTKGKLPVLDVFRPGPAPDPSRRLLPQRQPAGRDARPLRLVHRRRTGAIRDYGILLQSPLTVGGGVTPSAD
jgi:hypothetical protein